MPLSEIKVRAENWVREIGTGTLSAASSTVGGGSLPGQLLPSFALELTTKSPDKFLKKLREQSIPIIARTETDRILLDPRTVLYEQDEILLAELKNVLNLEKHEI